MKRNLPISFSRVLLCTLYTNARYPQVIPGCVTFPETTTTFNLYLELLPSWRIRCINSTQFVREIVQETLNSLERYTCREIILLFWLVYFQNFRCVDSGALINFDILFYSDWTMQQILKCRAIFYALPNSFHKIILILYIHSCLKIKKEIFFLLKIWNLQILQW